jgi:hypothetical protein
MSEWEKLEKLQSSVIASALRDAARAENVIESAISDIQLYSRDFLVSDDGKVLTTGGATPQEWLKQRREDRSHWWSENPAKKSDKTTTENPWLGPESEWNHTKQGQFFVQHGLEKTREAIIEAGQKPEKFGFGEDKQPTLPGLFDVFTAENAEKFDQNEYKPPAPPAWPNYSGHMSRKHGR